MGSSAAERSSSSSRLELGEVVGSNPTPRTMDRKPQGVAPSVMTLEMAGSIPARSSQARGPCEGAAGAMTPCVVGSTPTRAAKLYAIGRTDIPPGLRAAQFGHAIITWVLTHGRPPDNLVLVEVPDESSLIAVTKQLDGAGVRVEVFREPDLDDEMTSVAVGPEGWRLLSSLPLAMRDA